MASLEHPLLDAKKLATSHITAQEKLLTKKVEKKVESKLGFKARAPPKLTTLPPLAPFHPSPSSASTTTSQGTLSPESTTLKLKVNPLSSHPYGLRSPASSTFSLSTPATPVTSTSEQGQRTQSPLTHSLSRLKRKASKKFRNKPDSLAPPVPSQPSPDDHAVTPTEPPKSPAPSYFSTASASGPPRSPGPSTRGSRSPSLYSPPLTFASTSSLALPLPPSLGDVTEGGGRSRPSTANSTSSKPFIPASIGDGAESSGRRPSTATTASSKSFIPDVPPLPSAKSLADSPVLRSTPPIPTSTPGTPPVPSVKGPTESATLRSVPPTPTLGADVPPLPSTKAPTEGASLRSVPPTPTLSSMRAEDDGKLPEPPFSPGKDPLPRPSFTDETRSSVRSARTNTSSTWFDANATTARSSVVTRASSVSDYEGGIRDSTDKWDLVTDEILDMYGDDDPTVESSSKNVKKLQVEIPDSPTIPPDMIPPVPPLPTSQSVPPTPKPNPPTPKSAPPTVSTSVENEVKSIGLFPPLRSTPTSALASHSITSDASEDGIKRRFSRDRYGFKKTNNFITERDFDEWSNQYTVLLDRRKAKWDSMMIQLGLPIDKPTKFPSKNDNMKRLVRKGIPPEYRGAAWFWYGDGAKWLERNQGVYEASLEEAKGEALSSLDREAIERDLHRTFPDNIRFKPERERPESESSEPTLSADTSMSTDTAPEETPIIKALRRILQAFAVRNPHIGYCQSLNFLAGMLLLFLEDEEEKAFALLNIATNIHLPGNHNRQLGADVDISVLMSLIREQLPGVWEKIDDWGFKEVPDRLPTISLTTTSWFMSCFIGSLPTETVLRVWDSFFYEGAKTLFRTALAIFKLGLPQVRNVGESLEVLQILQAVPRRQLDPEPLLQCCFSRRGGGFGNLSQDTIEGRRAQKKKLLKAARAAVAAFQGEKISVDGQSKESDVNSVDTTKSPLERPTSSHSMKSMKSVKSIKPGTKSRMKSLARRKKSRVGLSDENSAASPEQSFS